MTNLVLKFSKIAATNFCVSVADRFYGIKRELQVGTGLIYDNILFPLFNKDTQRFETAEGLVLVLTHECDVDSANDRFFNDCILVCPIIKLEALIEDFFRMNKLNSLEGLIPEISKSNVFRMQYLPPISSCLEYGGYLYLNQITSTFVETFRRKEAKRVCALSAEALRIVDTKLENHLLRPKSQNLPRFH